jgi:hypothetical protein
MIRVQSIPAEYLRRHRAIQLLERIGNEESQDLLQTLAVGDPNTPVTRAAKAAFGRSRRSAAP